MSLSLNCQFSVWSVKISKTNQFVVTKNPKHHHFYLHTNSKIYAHVHFFKLQYTWSKQSEGQWENLMIQQRTKSKFTSKFNSNKQMHKNLRTSGHRQIQQLFLTITLQEKKSITFVMPTPTTNTLLFGFGLEAAMLIVRLETIGSKENDSNWTFAVFKSGLSNADFLYTYIFHSF